MSEVADPTLLRATQVIRAIQAEERLLAELRGALERQRAGIAAGEWYDGCGTTEYFLEGTEPAQQDCFEIELPDMEELNEIGSALQRRAERLFEALIARGIEQRRGRH